MGSTAECGQASSWKQSDSSENAAGSSNEKAVKVADFLPGKSSQSCSDSHEDQQSSTSGDGLSFQQQSAVLEVAVAPTSSITDRVSSSLTTGKASQLSDKDDGSSILMDTVIHKTNVNNHSIDGDSVAFARQEEEHSSTIPF